MERLQKISSIPSQTRCYGNTKQRRELKLLFLILHRIILKVTKFQLPTSMRFSTVVKNILGAHHAHHGGGLKATAGERITGLL